MQNSVFFILIFFLSSPSYAQNNAPGPAPSWTYRNGLEFFQEMANKQAEAINKQEDEKKILAKELRPVIGNNATFVYQSRSAEKTSVSGKFPRGIFWSDNGKMITALTSDSSHAGHFGTQQFIIYNDDTDEFDFFDVDHDKPLGEENPKINPGKCFLCHKQRNPLWAQYDIWEGVYGSRDDSFDTDRLKTNQAEKEAVLGEKKLFEAFKENFDNTRFKDYIDRALLDKKYHETNPKRGKESRTLVQSPNFQLGGLIAMLKSKSLFQRILKRYAEEGKINEMLATIFSFLSLDCSAKSWEYEKMGQLLEKALTPEDFEALNTKLKMEYFFGNSGKKVGLIFLKALLGEKAMMLEHGFKNTKRVSFDETTYNTGMPGHDLQTMVMHHFWGDLYEKDPKFKTFLTSKGISSGRFRDNIFGPLKQFVPFTVYNSNVTFDDKEACGYLKGKLEEYYLEFQVNFKCPADSGSGGLNSSAEFLPFEEEEFTDPMSLIMGTLQDNLTEQEKEKTNHP